MLKAKRQWQRYNKKMTSSVVIDTIFVRLLSEFKPYLREPNIWHPISWVSPIVMERISYNALEGKTKDSFMMTAHDETLQTL